MLNYIAEKNLDAWLGGYARHLVKRAVTPGVQGPRHLLFAICDHYEPLHGDVSRDVGRARVRAWRERYPEMARRFRDASGRPPRHSYFFPGEQYDADFIAPLAEMTAMGLGEVEVHLHHDGDTRESLRAARSSSSAATSMLGRPSSSPIRSAIAWAAAEN